MARRALEDIDILSLARPKLESFRDRTGETAHLAIRNGDELVYIDKIESLKVVRMASSIGARVAFHSTSVGKSFLSALPTADFKSLIKSLKLEKITNRTTVTFQALEEQVKKYRRLGYVNDDQENETGISCFGAAAKGNTFLNYVNPDFEDISFVVDDTPYKQNKFLPGSNIAIVDQAELVNSKPDYVVILPWNHKKEIIDRNQYIHEWGGKFVLAIPELKII